MFSGTEVEDIEEWMEDFETFAQEYEISESNRCNEVTRYTSHSVKDAIRAMPGYAEKVWATLKDEIIVSYRNTVSGLAATIEQLEYLAKSTGERGIKAPKEWEAYLRDFRVISNKLKKKGLLDADREASIFHKGLPSSVRDQLENKYMMTSKVRDTSKAPPIAEQVQVGRDLFNMNRFDARERYEISDEQIDEERRRQEGFHQLVDVVRAKGRKITGTTEGIDLGGKPSWLAPGIVPAERWTDRQGERTMNQNRIRDAPPHQPIRSDTDKDLDLVIGKLKQLNVGSAQYYNAYVTAVQEGYAIQGRVQPPIWASENAPPAARGMGLPRGVGFQGICFYCGNGGHRVNECETAGLHINKGWVRRDNGGRIVWPTGEFIHCPPGQRRSVLVADRQGRMGAGAPRAAGVHALEVMEGYPRNDQSYAGPISGAYEETYLVNGYYPSTFEARQTMYPSHPDYSHAANIRNKVPQGRPDGFRPGPAGGKDQSFRDKTTRFNAPPAGRGTSSNQIPLPREQPRFPTMKPEVYPRQPGMEVSDRKFIPDQDVDMKDGRKPATRNKPSGDEPRLTRTTDFARELNPEQIIQRLLNQRHTIELSTKELFAISGVATGIVNKGTRSHLGPAAGKQVSFGDATHYVAEYSYGEEDAEEAEWYEVNKSDETYAPERKPPPGRTRALIKIPAVLGGISVTAMLDTGSEIDMCSRRLYEAMANPPPLRTDLRLLMSGVNGPPKHIDGIMQQVELRIGDLKFPTDVHVNEDGPDYIILGQPFLNRARFSHGWDGDRPVVRLSSEDGDLEFSYKTVKNGELASAPTTGAAPRPRRRSDSDRFGHEDKVGHAGNGGSCTCSTADF
jgi:hypothetical protein